MFGKKEVEMRLCIKPERDHYLASDTVRGSMSIKNSHPLEIKSVSMVLQGTLITLQEKSGNITESKRETFYESPRVSMLEPEKKGKTIKLAVGEHQVPFAIRLAGLEQNDGISTFPITPVVLWPKKFRVEWVLVAQIIMAKGNHIINSQYELFMHVGRGPCFPAPDLITPGKQTFYTHSPIMYLITQQKTVYAPGDTVSLTINIKNQSRLSLLKMQAELQQHWKHKGLKDTMSILKFDVQGEPLFPVPARGEKEKVIQFRLPDKLIPTSTDYANGKNDRYIPITIHYKLSLTFTSFENDIFTMLVPLCIEDVYPPRDGAGPSASVSSVPAAAPLAASAPPPSAMGGGPYDLAAAASIAGAAAAAAIAANQGSAPHHMHHSQGAVPYGAPPGMYPSLPGYPPSSATPYGPSGSAPYGYGTPGGMPPGAAGAYPSSSSSSSSSYRQVAAPAGDLADDMAVVSLSDGRTIEPKATLIAPIPIVEDYVSSEEHRQKLLMIQQQKEEEIRREQNRQQEELRLQQQRQQEELRLQQERQQEELRQQQLQLQQEVERQRLQQQQELEQRQRLLQEQREAEMKQLQLQREQQELELQRVQQKLLQQQEWEQQQLQQQMLDIQNKQQRLLEQMRQLDQKELAEKQQQGVYPPDYAHYMPYAESGEHAQKSGPVDLNYETLLKLYTMTASPLMQDPTPSTSHDTMYSSSQPTHSSSYSNDASNYGSGNNYYGYPNL